MCLETVLTIPHSMNSEHDWEDLLYVTIQVMAHAGHQLNYIIQQKYLEIVKKKYNRSFILQ